MNAEAPLSIVMVQAFHYPSPKAHALQILETAFALSRRGHEVALQIRSSDPKAAHAEIERLHGAPLPTTLRVRVVGGRHKGLSGLGCRFQLLWDLLSRRQPTLFYARHRNQALWTSWWGRRLARRHPVVYEFHNLDHELARRAGRSSRKRLENEERRLCRNSAAVTAISRPLADDVRTLLNPPGEVRVIPDGVNLRRFQVEPPSFDGENLVLGYAGSLYPHKGVDRLLTLMQELPASHRLIIVGGNDAGDLERLRRRSRELGLDERVRFKGQVPADEVAPALAEAHLLLLPSDPEDPRSQRYTSPLKLFESLALGRPLIAAPSPTLLSVLDERDVAYLAPNPSGQGLATAVLDATRDAARWPQVAKNARTLARAYSWDARAQRIVALGRELLAAKDRNP